MQTRLYITTDEQSGGGCGVASTARNLLVIRHVVEIMIDITPRRPNSDTNAGQVSPLPRQLPPDRT